MNYDSDNFDFNDIMNEVENYTELKVDVPDYSYIDDYKSTIDDE